MSALWRLTWALPLVLAVGFAAILLLRRFLLPTSQTGSDRPRLQVRSSLAVSEKTQVHLLEVDGNGYLIVESERATTVQSLASSVSDVAPRPRTSWLHRLQQARVR